MNRKFHVVVGLLIILALLTLQAPRISTAQEKAVEYTLGVVLPYTGDLGEYGKGFKEGIDLAVEQMNAQLAAAKRPITFKVASQDTAGTPDGAAKAIQTVVQTSGAQVVVGPLSTGEVLGAKQFADQNKIVIIAPASTGMAGAIKDDYIFRVMNPPDNFAGQAFEGIAETRGYKNIVILNVDDPFGNGLVKIFQDRFKGGEISAVKYAKDAADLSSEVTKVSAEVARLSAAGSTAFFCACFLGDAQKVLKLAAVDANMGKVDWLGVENLYRPEMLANPDEAKFLASVKFTVVSASSTANPNTQPFIDAFKKKYNKEPGPFTNYAYDAANIAMLSIIFAGNNGEAVQKIVPFIADHYIGTQVQTYLDENGDQAVATFSIYRVKADGSGFEEIGTYDGSSGKVTFTTK
jgi:ABC-type branched-subunit amino acid transport system substrate-binding protein